MIGRHIDNALQKIALFASSCAVKPTDIDSLPRGLKGSNRSYQKFIILGHQRSGSSMMIGTLRTHPQIVGFGELFTADSVGFNVEGYDNYSTRTLALRNKYPVDFLDRHIFSFYPDEIQAVGFKFFPEHIERNARFRCIRQWLEQNKDIKLIHLTRKNLLAAYTSLLVAMKDGRFGILDKSERSTTTVTIDPTECLAEFQQRKASHEEIKQYIRLHEVFDIVYEDLAADPHRHLKAIQQFIGTDIRDLQVSKVKQETRSLSEVIENYDELQNFFRQTEWNYLFDM
ncbi:MAG: sulfotransferase [Candidatus Electrothrix sp. YB6]